MSHDPPPLSPPPSSFSRLLLALRCQPLRAHASYWYYFFAILLCFLLYRRPGERVNVLGCVLGAGWMGAFALAMATVGNTAELVSVWCWLSVTADLPIVCLCCVEAWRGTSGGRERHLRRAPAVAEKEGSRERGAGKEKRMKLPPSTWIEHGVGKDPDDLVGTIRALKGEENYYRVMKGNRGTRYLVRFLDDGSPVCLKPSQVLSHPEVPRKVSPPFARLFVCFHPTRCDD